MASIVAERRALRAEIAQRKREVLPKLKEAIRKAKRAKKERLKQCRADCKAAKKKATAQAREARKKLREHIKRARKRAETACKVCVDTETEKGLDRIEQALAALQTEREAIADMRKRAAAMKSERGRAGGRRAAELRAESDDRVIFNLQDDPYMIALFRKVRGKIKASPYRTRTEAFLEYVHDHPEELDEIRAKKEREYERQIEKEYEEMKGIKGCELALDQCQRELERFQRAETLAQEVPF